MSDHWINDRCAESSIPHLDTERAAGILVLHAACSPPCPRIVAAGEFLAEEKDTPQGSVKPPHGRK